MKLTCMASVFTISQSQVWVCAAPTVEQPCSRGAGRSGVQPAHLARSATIAEGGACRQPLSDSAAHHLLFFNYDLTSPSLPHRPARIHAWQLHRVQQEDVTLTTTFRDPAGTIPSSNHIHDHRAYMQACKPRLKGMLATKPVPSAARSAWLPAASSA